MKIKNVVYGQLVQVKNTNEPTLVLCCSAMQKKVSKDTVLVITEDGVDIDGHVRLCTRDDPDTYYYTTPVNLRKVK